VSLVDLFPTLLAAAGVEPPPSDGRALAPGGGWAGEGRARAYF
jgi:arylsulfatase A-like enzyme